MKRQGRITANTQYAEAAGLAIYSIAYATTSGEWDIVESFAAISDADANAYAEQNYSNRLSPSNDEWYVLDSTGRNINGGDQA